MDTLKFAELISYITMLCDGNHAGGLAEYHIKNIHTYITPAIPTAGSINLQPLFAAMESNRKIEAIKAYRTLTGEGLKESKDAVETVMSKFAPEATLGDILKTVDHRGA